MPNSSKIAYKLKDITSGDDAPWLATGSRSRGIQGVFPSKLTSLKVRFLDKPQNMINYDKTS